MHLHTHVPTYTCTQTCTSCTYLYMGGQAVSSAEYHDWQPNNNNPQLYRVGLSNIVVNT